MYYAYVLVAVMLFMSVVAWRDSAVSSKKAGRGKN